MGRGTNNFFRETVIDTKTLDLIENKYKHQLKIKFTTHVN